VDLVDGSRANSTRLIELGTILSMREVYILNSFKKDEPQPEIIKSTSWW
jgi:hypothetical protein